MNLAGISLDLRLAPGNWAPSVEPLYVGIYSKKGGREFALEVQNSSPLASSGNMYKLSLGSPCCNRESNSALLVDNSNNLLSNDPKLNPILFSDIEFVYLRKYGGPSSNSDDYLELNSATVLLCDDAGNLRRFRKEGRLHFAKEAGLQHWLTEIAPPGCKVTICLNRIEHQDEARFPAGFDWQLNWLAGTTGNAQWSNTLRYNIDRGQEPDEWVRMPNDCLSFTVPGCCGEVPIFLFCQSIEKDWPSSDDIGSGTASLRMDCSITGNNQQVQVATPVNGNSPNRRSLLTYFFTVHTECLA